MLDHENVVSVRRSKKQQLDDNITKFYSHTIIKSILTQHSWIMEYLNLEQWVEPKEKCKSVPQCYRKGLKIGPLPTNKSKIKQRPNAEAGIIPTHASSVIFSGKSGSGKTNLMISLLTRKNFYKGYFDKIYLFSPTAHGGDDLVSYINPTEIDTDFDIKKLEKIISDQAKAIEEKTIVKSDKILLLFDDIQSDARFMRSKAFLKCFIQCRHLNISTWLCGQSWTRTPRACRLQSNNIFFFPGSQSEVDLMVQEFRPPGLSKKDFYALIGHATDEPYQFLHVNMRQPAKQRFRKNLDTLLEF